MIIAVIRFHTPSKALEPEKYFHHLLMLYFPWRKETDLIGDDHTYSSKFEDPSVKLVVQRNQAEFEPFAESIDEALEFIRNNPKYSAYGERFDAFSEQENSDDLLELISKNPLERSSTEQQIPADNILMEEIQSQDSKNYITLPVSFCTQPLEATDVFRVTERSLNTKQRYAYEIVLKWCRDTVKNLSSLKPLKTFKHGPSDPDLPCVLLLAPTGVAAINVNGVVSHSALGIPKNVFGEHTGSLPHE